VTPITVSPRPRKAQKGNADGPLVLYDQYALGGAATSIDGYVANVTTYVRALSCKSSRPAKLYNLANVDTLDRSNTNLLTCWVGQSPRNYLPFVPESADVP
jgi:hypothetical protein